MKKILVLLVTFFVLNASSKAQYVTIPDPYLRQYFIDNFPTCMNASQMLDTTCSAVVNETYLYPNIYGNYTAINWDGFQYFKNLVEINFDGLLNVTNLPELPATLRKLEYNALSSAVTLPNLPAGLIYLDISYSSLTSLPALPASLQHLDCEWSSLQSLSALPSSLIYLNCTWSGLSSLPALPSSLDTLICSYSRLTALPALSASLTYLVCDNNQLTAVPSFPAGLKYVDCNNNQITDLPALPAGLEYLDAEYNQISTIPTLPATLKTLSIGINTGITSLPALPAVLENLDIKRTSVNSLPAALPAGLKTLVFNTANVSSLPALPATLEILDCSNNQISVMPALPQTLTTLSCANNHLAVVPVLPQTLTDFACGNNQLTVLPALPQSLRNLECGGNLYTSLPSLPNGIHNFDCNSSLVTSLPPLPHSLINFNCSNSNIYFLPALPDSLEMLNVRNDIYLTCLPVLPSLINSIQPLQIIMDNRISCVPNLPNNVQLTVFDTATMNMDFPSNYPLCSAINNIHHCDAFPLMTGYVYNDNNNNLVKDANEPYRANIKVQLSNGAYTMTNSNGYYQIPADSIGNYTVTVTPPNYFTSAPLQFNYNFNSYDTLLTGNFALQATSTVDSLTISALPVNWAARPGFSFPYLISYQNVGTTTLSPNIVFNYDNTRLNYDSSSNAAVMNSGSALSLAETGLVAGDQKAFVGYFRVNPAAVIGDSIRAYASIHANAITANDSTITEIRGAYDPNDKSATPKLTPSQVTNGNYIYYTIRFQNTGTDTAFSVVITDTLNSQLQANTLEVINTSHPAKITVKGNVVYFEFINILLPDSNVNEMKSHGYVSFRIKPQPTVVLNSTIPNKAAIYFDYNSPVITNTAVTTISNAQTVPLKLVSFKVIRSIASNANAYWNTYDEINVLSYNIEMSLDGRNFNAIAYEKAKGYQYNDYTKTVSIPNNDILYFRLKMIDVDGRFTYSPIVTLRNDQSNSFSFLNNPVKNELNISIQDESLKNTTARIYNAQGLLVKTVLLQRDIETVNVSSLAAGMYYLLTEKGSSQFIIVE